MKENAFLTLYAPISQNGLTRPNNPSANCQRIVLSVFDDFLGLVLKGLTSYRCHKLDDLI